MTHNNTVLLWMALGNTNPFKKIKPQVFKMQYVSKTKEVKELTLLFLQENLPKHHDHRGLLRFIRSALDLE